MQKNDQNLLEKTLSASIKDVQTVTQDSTPLNRLPDGCWLRSATPHSDARGMLVEILNSEWALDNHPIEQVYMTTLRPGIVKGWALHKQHEDRYFVVSGDMQLVLYDVRPESSTYGQVFSIVLSDRHHAVINVPVNVWHADWNIGTKDVVLLNMPSRRYNHANPDKYRLPLDTDLIPYSFPGATGW